MDITKKVKKQEALRRPHVLADRFNVGLMLRIYFSQKRLYCSYGYSMDNIRRLIKDMRRA